MNDLPEPPLADFDTACSQMHDHDPIKCAPENIPTIDIPVRHLIAMLAAIAYQTAYTDEDPDLQQVLRDLASFPLDEVTGTLPLPAESAWRIAFDSSAASTFDLDECADETYQNAAVIAEIEVMRAVEDQAPEVDERMQAEIDELLKTL
ncbi:hypothetical protein KDL01_04410 [Actinospica durhamensis]|uniref:Uncharacterized protein n=1 Tax=Actinospica durhamensis TaxID=1508375 RepID=A0A941EJE9_9ACTN|nr:hypothetical protein [Actinospica durhamensis]MBR7832486.1 hypothetical protein [Actinospica durhamensis]